MIFTSYAGNTIIPLRPTAALIEPVITRNRLFLNFWPHLGALSALRPNFHRCRWSIGKRCSRGKKGANFRSDNLRAIGWKLFLSNKDLDLLYPMYFYHFSAFAAILYPAAITVFTDFTAKNAPCGLHHSLNRLYFLISRFIIKVIDTKIISRGAWIGEGKLFRGKLSEFHRYFITGRLQLQSIERKQQQNIFSIIL